MNDLHPAEAAEQPEPDLHARVEALRERVAARDEPQRVEHEPAPELRGLGLEIM